MIVGRLTQAVSITGLAGLLLAANASAGTINYSTNGAGTDFVYSNGVLLGTPTLTMLSSNDPSQSSLVFTPNASSTTGTPSGPDLGDFPLTCTGCSPSTVANYNSFVLDIVVTDITDGATGEFIGTSSGGSVSSNSATIQITWSTATAGSLTLGPNTHNVITGNFGSTIFDKQVTTTVLAAPIPEPLRVIPQCRDRSLLPPNPRR